MIFVINKELMHNTVQGPSKDHPRIIQGPNNNNITVSNSVVHLLSNFD